jgi:acyl-CoA thioesterase-1
MRGAPVGSIRKNMETMIERLKVAKITVVLAGMRIPPNYGFTYSEQFYAVYLELARKYSLKLIPFFLENVAGIPDLNLEDGIHPTVEGYRIVTKTVLEAIKPLL